MYPARKQILIRLELGLADPGANRFSGLFSDFELNRSVCFLLHNYSPR